MVHRTTKLSWHNWIGIDRYIGRIFRYLLYMDYLGNTIWYTSYNCQINWYKCRYESPICSSIDKSTITGMYEHLHSLEDEEKSDLMPSNLYSALKLWARNRNRHLSTRLTCQIVSLRINFEWTKTRIGCYTPVSCTIVSSRVRILFYSVKTRIGTYSTRSACQIVSEPFRSFLNGQISELAPIQLNWHAR